MNRILTMRTRPYVALLVGTAIVLLSAALFITAAYAQEADIASVPLSARIPAQGHTTPGLVTQVAETAVPAGLVGGHCDVSVSGANNESVHPDSDILVTSATGIVLADVERASGAVTVPSGTLTLGDTVTIAVRLGPDGLFSGGTLVVDFDCTSPPPPETTTVPTTTATTVPTVTTVPPAPCVDNPATATDECGTLPHTGASTALLWVAAIGGALLLVGIVVGKTIKRTGDDR